MLKKFFISLFYCMFFLSLASCSKPAAEQQQPPAEQTAPAQKSPLKIDVVSFEDDNKDDTYVTEYITVMKSLLAENGIIENQDYTVRMNSAQSEMSNIPALIDLAKNDKAGLLITFHAPVLYNAIQKAPELKKVFAIVSNPFVLGGGKSDTDHLPNLCGMYFKSPIDGLLDLIKEASPKIKKIGVVFTIGEDESVAYKDEIGRAHV